MRALRAIACLGVLAAVGVVSVGSAGAAGETIRVEDPNTWQAPLFDLDSGYTNSEQLMQLACAPLYGFTDVAGPTGVQLVPDVAAAYPTASPDGLTETIDLRTGFGFSPPSTEQVTASSFVYAWQRWNALSGSLGPFPNIASMTAASPTQLVVTLDTPDPNFADTISNFCADPSTAPPTAFADPTTPTAGPYYVAESLPGELVFRQNPNYGGSRIRNLGEIDYLYGVPVATAIADVESGAADYAPNLNNVGSVDFASLRAAYGPGSPAAAAGHQQYFEDQENALTQLTLNAARPVFAAQSARQAVAWAIDRTNLAAAANLASPTDQFAFPGMSGYVDWNIYPFGGDSVTAMSAAMDAGISPSTPADINVEIRSQPTFGVPEATMESELRSALEPLGFILHMNVVPVSQMFHDISTPGSPWDLTAFTWLANTGDAGSWLDDLFGAGAENFSGWSDPTFQSRLADATAMPYGPSRDAAFAQIDHDLAAGPVPEVPLFDNLRAELFSARIGCQLYQFPGMDLNDLCVRVAGTVPAGGTLSTGTTADASSPLQTSVTTPTGGDVSIQQGVTTSTVTNYQLLAQQLTITAPAASATSPLQLEFTLDSSLVGTTDPATIDVIRDGVPVPDCVDTSGQANPDPCLASRTVLAGGDLQLVVLSSHASLWNFGVADVAGQLADLKQAIVLRKLGPGSSLAAKAQAAIDREAAGDHAGLCNALKALDNEIRAQNGKKLSAADAAELRADVARIEEAAGC